MQKLLPQPMRKLQLVQKLLLRQELPQLLMRKRLPNVLREELHTCRPRPRRHTATATAGPNSR